MPVLGICARPRDDDLIDDRPALADLGETDPTTSPAAARAGIRHGYTWAVCEPTTGELLAEASPRPVAATVHTRARHGHADAAAIAAQSVRRFAAAALGHHGVTVSMS
jgi:hypothetical protein